jgi:choline dehydrogenase
VNQRDVKRVSAATAYLTPALRRANLVVRTNSSVEQILIENARASGVAYLSGRTRRVVHARRDVILAAGAVNSPQLLMCSGIGPGAILQSLGITVHLNQPSVGENLQDHLTSGIALGGRRAVSLAKAQSIGSIAKYLVAKRGPLSSNVAEGYGFIKSDAALDLPDLELLFVPSLFVNEGLDIPREHGMTLAAVLLQPLSRGRVSIASPDPTVPPLIDPRYLSDPDGHDAERMRFGIETCIKIAAAPSLASEITELVQPPGPLDATTVEASLRHFSQTLYHPVGTCRMGVDESAVVDGDLRVRGIQGLRVVDASVIPTIPRGHTHAPTVVLAERAADLIAR